MGQRPQKAGPTQLTGLADGPGAVSALLTHWFLGEERADASCLWSGGGRCELSKHPESQSNFATSGLEASAAAPTPGRPGSALGRRRADPSPAQCAQPRPCSLFNNSIYLLFWWHWVLGLQWAT